ncbi:hypothetical protein C8R46DRAFT_1185010 [Mycena filopes]|nr:hypothetical protein C8R46DRAFT_1185010 [Mycena filopes]
MPDLQSFTDASLKVTITILGQIFEAVDWVRLHIAATLKHIVSSDVVHPPSTSGIARRDLVRVSLQNILVNPARRQVEKEVGCGVRHTASPNVAGVQNCIEARGTGFDSPRPIDINKVIQLTGSLILPTDPRLGVRYPQPERQSFIGLGYLAERPKSERESDVVCGTQRLPIILLERLKPQKRSSTPRVRMEWAPLDVFLSLRLPLVPVESSALIRGDKDLVNSAQEQS